MMCEADPELTITSVVSAFDDLKACHVGGIGKCGGWSGCPLFRPHVLWASIHVSLGGRRRTRDVLMPLLFSLGQHSGLEAAHRQLRVNEKLFAYVDDVHIASKPNRAGAVYTSVEENLYGHARIRIHMGKTCGISSAWNQPSCSREEGIWAAHPRTRHSRLGCSSGHLDFVRSHLQKTAGHQTLLEMILLLPNVQFALVMLLHCASARAH